MLDIPHQENRLSEPVVRTNGHAGDDEHAVDRRRRSDDSDPLRVLLRDNVSFHRAFYVLAADRRDRAAQSTVEALVFQLRSGIASLSERDARRRLAELSRDQVVTVCDQLLNLRLSIATAWTPEEAGALMIIWEDFHA